jgi:retinol dehydrogenase 12
VVKVECENPGEGSWNQLWAATGTEVVSAEYYEPVGVLGSRTKKAEDQELRKELWDWAEEKLQRWTV